MALSWKYIQEELDPLITKLIDYLVCNPKTSLITQLTNPNDQQPAGTLIPTMKQQNRKALRSFVISHEKTTPQYHQSGKDNIPSNWTFKTLYYITCPNTFGFERSIVDQHMLSFYPLCWDPCLSLSKVSRNHPLVNWVMGLY